MVKTYESRFPPSPNLDKVTVSFDMLINTDLYLRYKYFISVSHTITVAGSHC